MNVPSSSSLYYVESALRRSSNRQQRSGDISCELFLEHERESVGSSAASEFDHTKLPDLPDFNDPEYPQETCRSGVRGEKRTLEDLFGHTKVEDFIDLTVYDD